MNLHDGALVPIFLGERSRALAAASRGESGARSKVGDLVIYRQRFCAPFLRARFGRTERGASLVEYALLVALIAVVCIVAVSLLGQNASKRFSQVGSAIQ